jgi:CDP-diacylglycerol--serine O-phosphatidyltransferase
LALPRFRGAGRRPACEPTLSRDPDKSNRRLLDRWRLKSPSGAEVVSLRQLNPKERLRVTAPSMFTTGNMACGFSAILLAFSDEFMWAAVALAGSIVLDIADGAVARLVGATSPFGVQLDSLADLVSFGLAPAVLVHTWALPENPITAWLSAFLWLACAAFRLARFNVTVDPLAEKKYFVGLPSPGATLVVIATIFALRTPEHGPWVLVPVAVSVLPALLMITTVRFRSFRGLLSPKTRQARVITTVLAAALLAGLVIDASTTGLVVACSYLLTAPLGVLTAPARARIFGPQAVAPPRRRMQSVFLPISDDDD